MNAPKDTNFKAQISIFTKCKRIGIIPYILTFHFSPLHIPFFRWQGRGIPLFVLLRAVFQSLKDESIDIRMQYLCYYFLISMLSSSNIYAFSVLKLCFPCLKLFPQHCINSYITNAQRLTILSIFSIFACPLLSFSK